LLSSIDTYLYTQIESTLGNLLTNRYIIDELLKEVQPTVREAFIKAYVYDEKRNPAPPEIPIVYTMPQDKQMLRGAIYIGLREGEESTLVSVTKKVHMALHQEDYYPNNPQSQ